MSEKNKGGGNSGEGKTYHKTSPPKRFWTPPLMIGFPPPLCSRNVILLRGNGHRPDESHFLRPPKLVLEGALYSTCSPQKIARYVLYPRLCEFPKTIRNKRDTPHLTIPSDHMTIESALLSSRTFVLLQFEQPFSAHLLYQARKRHININFSVRLVLGRTRVCPGDFTGLGQIR